MTWSTIAGLLGLAGSAAAVTALLRRRRTTLAAAARAVANDLRLEHYESGSDWYAARGIVDGMAVSVRASTSPSPMPGTAGVGVPQIIFNVFYPADLGFRFRVGRRGAFVSTIGTGAPAFDEVAVVDTSDESGLRELLDSDVRRFLLVWFTSSRTVSSIDQVGIERRIFYTSDAVTVARETLALARTLTRGTPLPPTECAKHHTWSLAETYEREWAALLKCSRCDAWAVELVHMHYVWPPVPITKEAADLLRNSDAVRRDRALRTLDPSTGAAPDVDAFIRALRE